MCKTTASYKPVLTCRPAHLFMLERSCQKLQGSPVGGGAEASLPTALHSQQGALQGLHTMAAQDLISPSEQRYGLPACRCSPSSAQQWPALH